MAEETQGEHVPRSRIDMRREAAERQRKALELRALRYSYDRIATELGYANRGAAHAAVKKGLAAIPREAAMELRVSELEGLDIAERALASKLSRGDFGAIDRMIKIKDMRAKLTGLYEEQVDSGVEEVKTALKGWLSQVRIEDAEAEAADLLAEGGDDDVDEAAQS